jgi:acyl-CoA synthetase (AMP-forming)/AMP-acid ligase II
MITRKEIVIIARAASTTKRPIVKTARIDKSETTATSVPTIPVVIAETPDVSANLYSASDLAFSSVTSCERNFDTSTVEITALLLLRKNKVRLRKYIENNVLVKRSVTAVAPKMVAWVWKEKFSIRSSERIELILFPGVAD